MTVHETTTSLLPTEVIDRAATFFARVRAPNAAGVERRGETYLRLHLDMGELVLGAIPAEHGTRVRGSASRGGSLVAQFLSTLPRPGPAGAAERPMGRAA